MRRTMTWIAALLVLLLCGFAAAEMEDTGRDVIFIVTRGPRMDRDDPQQTRFEVMAALAAQYAEPNNRCIVVPCPVQKEQIGWQKLEDSDDAAALKKTLEELETVDYSDAPRVVSESLDAACELASQNRPTTVVLVHTGAIDVSDYEEKTVHWLDGLGDQLIMVDTRNPVDKDGKPVPVVSGLSQEKGAAYILPLDEAASKQLMTSGLAAYVAEPVFTAKRGGGTFKLETDGAAVLTLLLPESTNQETLKLKTSEGSVIKSESNQMFKLGSLLCWRIPLPDSQTRGEWTLTFDKEDAAEDSALPAVHVLCSWTALTGRADEASENEFGGETELSLTLDELSNENTLELKRGYVTAESESRELSNADTPELKRWLRKNAVASVEIYELSEGKGVSKQRRVQTVALKMNEDGWSGTVELDAGRYEVRYFLKNKAGENLLSDDVVQSVSVINKEPQITEKARALSEQTLVYNLPGQETSLSWTFDELFEDTPGDKLIYTYHIKEKGYTVEEQSDEDGALIGLTLTAPKGKKLDPAVITATAKDGEGAECELLLNIEPVNALELLKQIELNGRISGTPKKNEPFSVTVKMKAPDLLPLSVTQAIELEISLGDGVWHKMTQTTDGEWRYDEKAPKTTCDYNIILRARLRIGDAALAAEVSEDGYYEAATCIVGSYHVSNSSPTAVQDDMTFDLNVEPFLKPHDFVMTDKVNPGAWFTDADGDELTITMTTEKGTLVQEGSVIRIEKSAAGSELIVDADSEVALAVCRGGDYRVTISASDDEKAESAPVTIVIHAHSQTKKAVILIIISAVLLALIAAGLILWYRSKPSFAEGCALTMTLTVGGMLGEIESAPIELKKYGKGTVTINQLYTLGGIPRVKGLPAEVLKSVIVRPGKGGKVHVEAKLGENYTLESCKDEKTWLIKKDEKQLLAIIVSKRRNH